MYEDRLLPTNLHVRPFILRARKNGAKIGVIDPVRAARRNRRTGTFASTPARARMMNVMIAEDLTPDVGCGCAPHRAMMLLHCVLISASSFHEIRWNCPPSLGPLRRIGYYSRAGLDRRSPQQACHPRTWYGKAQVSAQSGVQALIRMRVSLMCVDTTTLPHGTRRLEHSGLSTHELVATNSPRRRGRAENK